MTEVNIYTTEPERRKAIQELTALRRELKTETAAGAAAAAKDPRFIAAKERLDKAKSAAGLRTSAQDLELLNRIDTGKKSGEAVTSRLNTQFNRYYEQAAAAYKNPEKVPTWTPGEFTITKEDIDYGKLYDKDLSNARWDWVWYVPRTELGEPGEPGWRLTIIGSKTIPKDRSDHLDDDDYVTDLFGADRITLGEWARQGGKTGSAPELVHWTKGKASERQEMYLGAFRNRFYKNYFPFGESLPIAKQEEIVQELVEALPNIKYSELEEVIYRLTLEKDNDITADDVLNKYNELFGEG